MSVVTNLSADHLGLQGIDTVDELAEVKGVIVRMTKRGGWAVLNADDDRAWAMRRLTRANISVFSMEPHSDRVERVLERGGRAAVLVDGVLVLRGAGRRARRLAPAEELPVTVAGLSRHNIANALAASAACDALASRHRASRAGCGPSRRTRQPTRAASTCSSVAACSRSSTSRTTRPAWPA